MNVHSQFQGILSDYIVLASPSSGHENKHAHLKAQITKNVGKHKTQNIVKCSRKQKQETFMRTLINTCTATCTF